MAGKCVYETSQLFRVPFDRRFRTHGTRNHNEVWSYGKQAEPILEKYLRLRYRLMP